MQIGDPIILSLSLYDRAPDMYVQAILWADGVEMVESPITLTHIGEGTYFFKDKNNLTFPENVFDIRAQYIVYNDAGFTDEALRYETAEDIFRLSNPPAGGDPAVISKINELISIVTSHDLNSELIGEITEAFELTGYVLEEDLVGYISGSDELVGFVLTEDDISGTINLNDELDGFFDI